MPGLALARAMNSSRVWKGENLQFWKPVPVEAGALPSPAQSGFRTNWNCRPSLRAGVSVMTFRLGTRAEFEEIFPVISSSFPCYEPTLNRSIRCGHVLLTTEKVRALVDNIRGKKDRDIEGDVVKKGTTMVDLFLREVQRMHQLRQDINEMTPEKADELIRGLGDDAAEDWVFAARDAQLPPPDLSWCWLSLGGRGAGKSHSMSAAVHTAVRAGISRIHFIAPTTSDFHDVNIEGKSGIFATCGHDARPRWMSSRRRRRPRSASTVCGRPRSMASSCATATAACGRTRLSWSSAVRNRWRRSSETSCMPKSAPI